MTETFCFKWLPANNVHEMEIAHHEMLAILWVNGGNTLQCEEA